MVSKAIAASEGVDRVVEISRRNCRNSLSLLERRQEVRPSGESIA